MNHEIKPVITAQRPPKTTGTYAHCTCGSRSMVFPGVSRTITEDMERWFMRHLGAR